MLALALTLSLLGAAPRGFAATTPAELVTEVETRLPAWLKGGGDRKALLASPAELDRFAAAIPVQPADRKVIAAALLKEQSERPTRTTFSATRALLTRNGPQAQLSFFEAGHRCTIALLDVGPEGAARFVLVGGPFTDDRPFDPESDERPFTYLEKKNGAWAVTPVPKPPPPDCAAVLKQAAKSVFVAERSYFAEMDTYSEALEKLGVDVPSLGIASLKITVVGTGPAATFTADLAYKDGLVRINDKNETTILKACTR